MTAPAFVEPETAPLDWAEAPGHTDLSSGPATEPPPASDPAAPYGRKPDGTPYKVSPEERARLGQQLTAGRQRAAAGGPKPASRRPSKSRGGRGPGTRPAAPPAPSYATITAGLLQLPAMALAVASKWYKPAAYDAMAISYHTPAIAQAVGKIADEDARWATVLDKAASVGPYGELTLALMPMLMQFACNHGMLPPNPEMGVLDPEELMKAGGGDPEA